MKAILIKPIDGLEVGKTYDACFDVSLDCVVKILVAEYPQQSGDNWIALLEVDTIDEAFEYFFVLQELPETITRQIQEKLQFLCIDAYEAGLTARDKNEERVITGAVVNERIGLVLSAVKDLLAGVSSDIGDTNGS